MVLDYYTPWLPSAPTLLRVRHFLCPGMEKKLPNTTCRLVRAFAAYLYMACVVMLPAWIFFRGVQQVRVACHCNNCSKARTYVHPPPLARVPRISCLDHWRCYLSTSDHVGMRLIHARIHRVFSTV